MRCLLIVFAGLSIAIPSPAPASAVTWQCLPFKVHGQGKPSHSVGGAKRSALADCSNRCKQGDIKECGPGWRCRADQPRDYKRDPAVVPTMHRFDVLARPCRKN